MMYLVSHYGVKIYLEENNYNSQKQILIHRINELLTSELTSLKQLELPNYSALNTSIVAKYMKVNIQKEAPYILMILIRNTSLSVIHWRKVKTNV